MENLAREVELGNLAIRCQQDVIAQQAARIEELEEDNFEIKCILGMTKLSDEKSEKKVKKLENEVAVLDALYKHSQKELQEERLRVKLLREQIEEERKEREEILNAFRACGNNKDALFEEVIRKNQEIEQWKASYQRLFQNAMDALDSI